MSAVSASVSMWSSTFEDIVMPTVSGDRGELSIPVGTHSPGTRISSEGANDDSVSEPLVDPSLGVVLVSSGSGAQDSGMGCNTFGDSWTRISTWEKFA